MKKIIILIPIILLMSGCFDYVEINDLVIISGMLIDYKDNEYEITSELIENENKTNIKVYTTKCNSIDECIFKLSKISNKDIFISHLKALIITENVINNKENYYDYFLREPKSKMNFSVYYTESKYKDEIMNIYKEDNGSALYLKDLISFNNRIFSSSSPLTFLDLIYKIKEDGIDPIYPNLTIKENNNKKVLYLDNLISFKNGKNIILNDTESITYNLLNNTLSKTVLDIPCDNKDFSIVLNSSNTKLSINNNNLIIKTNIKSKISSYSCNYDLDDPKSIDKLSNITNKYIKDNISALISKQDKKNIDFIGIKSYLNKHNKSNINSYNIKVNTVINSIGEIKNER